MSHAAFYESPSEPPLPKSHRRRGQDVSRGLLPWCQLCGGMVQATPALTHQTLLEEHVWSCTSTSMGVARGRSGGRGQGWLEVRGM